MERSSQKRQAERRHSIHAGICLILFVSLSCVVHPFCVVLMQFLMFTHIFDLSTQAQIARANALYAVRPADLISSQREQVRGRGKYKAWLPEAVLRCAFGNCQSHSRIVGKQSQTPNTMAHSARAQGAWLSANHKYVQQVRNAVSCWIWSKEF